LSRGLRTLILLGAGVWTACSGWAGNAPVIDYDWGPFAASWTDVHGNERSRFAGPFVDTIRSPEDWTFRAVRPLWSTWSNPGLETTNSEYLWPVASKRRQEEQRSWRVLLSWGWNWDVDDPESRHRLWILPFYFQGRSKNGHDYLALFPLGGTIREFAFWDRIDFALFPLWVRSQMGDIEANTWLWPFISRTSGKGVERFRVFPFYGYNEREGRGRKTFVLWPFWTHVRYTMPGSSGTGWILFPLTGHLKLTDQETWWVLPPFFRVSVGDEQNRIFGPWPFYQREKGEVDKFYLWPLYGRKQLAGVDQRFFLWPLGHYEKSTQPTGVKSRLHLLPFFRHYTSEPSEVMKGEEMSSSYTKVWPLYSHLSKGDGEVRRTVIPDLNPMRGGPIERNYAPFWRLYMRSEVEDRVDTEVLWGLYRSLKRGEDYRYRSLFPLFSWSREEEGGHFSLLKGLLARERDGEKKRWRVLYLFRFGGKEEP